MKIQRKIPALLAGVAMMALVGCGSTSQPTDTSSDVASAPSSTVPDSEPQPMLMRAALRKAAPTFNSWTDQMLDTTATEICTEFDYTHDAKQVFSVLYNSGSGIPPVDIGALMGYSVAFACPDHQFELDTWSTS